ncbi:MAG TPA: DEAD/DEAH box helicase [Cytophagales bacterium]|nr:DEAD/DEAH box helicase [Cytophagales bacterium]
MLKRQNLNQQSNELKDHPNDYIFRDFDISALSFSYILKHTSAQLEIDSRNFLDIHPQTLEINFGTFINLSGSIDSPVVEVIQGVRELKLSCECSTPKRKLCEHQAQVLFNIMDRKEFRIFFDEKLRHEKMKKVAVDYGLEHESNPDNFFQLEYNNKSVEIKPKIKELLPINKETDKYLKEHLIPKQRVHLPSSKGEKENTKQIVVLAHHKFYNHLYIELFETQTTLDGKVKNPLKSIAPLDLIWKAENNDEIKFYTGISSFQNNYVQSESDIEGLKALVKNPLKLEVFYHDGKTSANITSTSIVPVQLKNLKMDLRLSVDKKDIFYEVCGHLVINDKPYDLKNLTVRYGYFILVENTLHLIDNTDLVRVIDFFRKNNNILVIHHSKFDAFRQNILSELEHKIKITYSYLKAATKKQLEDSGFDQTVEKIIYLSDSEEYVVITPVVRYGGVEIPVLSKKQLYAIDQKGNAFLLERDEELEVQFTSILLRQHPDFQDQLSLDYFYLHRDRFLDENWFLEAFEDWNNYGITILGFGELNNNKRNPNKAKISIIVSSGLDWFNTTIDVKYGDQKVSLKHLHKSLRNKSKFVQLGDGTLGILPDEWIERFSRFFYSGEIVGEVLRTPKTNFSEIAELYDEEALTQEVKNQLAMYKSKTSDFEAIHQVEVPTELKANLREYQKQGLNWLNFLDDFNFGGCLADDMGLGKTIQIIAFILSQRKKTQHNVNLIVVPTSLIFNWQAEVEKFAPSIKILTVYGSFKFDKYYN